MASYCLTVTRLRVRKRLFALTEFLFACSEVHKRRQMMDVTVSTVSTVASGGPPAGRGRAECSSRRLQSGHRVPVWLLTATRCNGYEQRPTWQETTFFTVTAFRTGAVSVGINRMVVGKGSRVCWTLQGDRKVTEFCWRLTPDSWDRCVSGPARTRSHSLF